MISARDRARGDCENFAFDGQLSLVTGACCGSPRPAEILG